MKKPFLKLIALIILSSTLLFAQPENTIWYFGNSTSGIQFNDNGDGGFVETKQIFIK